MLDPVANTLDLRQPFDKDRGPAHPGGHGGHRRRDLRARVLRQPPASRSGAPEGEARAHAARLRRGGPARNRRRVRLHRPQPAAKHGSEPDRLRGAVRPPARGGQRPRPDLPRRAVSHARMDERRHLAQQHRVRARSLDRAAPDLREAWRRRPVPHSLRPLPRHPHGTGHAVDLPVSPRRRLRLPHRWIPREGAGHRRPRRDRVGVWRPDHAARRLGRRRTLAERRRPAPCLEETDGARRTRAAGHGAPRSARLPAEPDRRLARPPAGGARAAAAERGGHVPDRRARVSEGPDSGSDAARADPAGLAGVRSRNRPGGRRACTRCSTKCLPRRAFPSRASGESHFGRSGQPRRISR